jgi:hypothetical protein
MDDDIIPRIKFIGKIQKGEKMNVKHMQVHPDSIVTKIIRSFVHTDTRANTFTFINTSIKKGFDILAMHLDNNRQFDRTLCQNLIADLRQCKAGMQNVKDTYIEDLMFCCKMDALMEETEARIHDIESKYAFLKNAIPAAAMAMAEEPRPMYIKEVKDVKEVKEAKDVKEVKEKDKQK